MVYLSVAEPRGEFTDGLGDLRVGLRPGLKEHRARPRLDWPAFQRQHQPEADEVG